MDILFYIGAFICIFIVVYSTASGLSKTERYNLIVERANAGTGISLHDLELSKSFYERIILPAILKLSRVVVSIAPDRVLNNMNRLLAQADIMISSSIVVAIQIVLAVALPVIMTTIGVLNVFHGVMGWLVLMYWTNYGDRYTHKLK